ncbi:hypothetical protein ACA910_010007 [Epithemia clementina (nom. ined.)]
MDLWKDITSKAIWQQKGLVQATAEMRNRCDTHTENRNKKTKKLLLENVTLNARACFFLKNTILAGYPDPNSRLQALHLRCVRIGRNEKDACKAATDLGELLQLNHASLREIEFGFGSYRSGWMQEWETSTFIYGLLQQGPSLKNLCKVSFERVRLCGDKVGHCLGTLLAETPVEEICFLYCSLDLRMFGKMRHSLEASKTIRHFRLVTVPASYTRRLNDVTGTITRQVLSTLSEMQQLRTVDLSMEPGETSHLPLISKLLGNNALLETAKVDAIGLFRNNVHHSDQAHIPQVQCPLESFVSAITNHSSLQTLYLSGCKIRNDLARLLFRALECNETLTELWLQDTCNNHHLTCSGEWVESLPKLGYLRILCLPHGILDKDRDFARLVEALRRNYSLEACWFHVPPTATFHVPPTATTFCNNTNATSSQIEPIMRRNKLLHHGVSSMGKTLPASWPIYLESFGKTYGCDTMVFDFVKRWISEAAPESFLDKASFAR